jgi:predicted dehydrogenase
VGGEGETAWGRRNEIVKTYREQIDSPQIQTTPMHSETTQMNRREFMIGGLTGLAISAMQSRGAAPATQSDVAGGSKPLRVGLIGTGWYGKVDLFNLIRVAPVEVVSLCDVDKTAVDEAEEMVAARQVSGKKPRTYGDYREMLKEKDLDIVLIGTPDHRHALTMIAAVESGADVYVQKPISVDIAEGEAMVAAARAHGRVVQVGTQRRSTPHLIEARDTIVKTGKLGKIGLVEVYCYYHMRAGGNPPDSAPPPNLDYEMWTGPAPMRSFNKIMHPRGWRAFMEYGNGIVGDMCVHMFDMSRWMLDLGWPKSVSSSGGIQMDKTSIANISDTQTATFDYDDLQIVWQHRTWGDAPDPTYPWGATIYGDKGTLKLAVTGYDFTPLGGKPVHVDPKLEPQIDDVDKGTHDYEPIVAPAIRAHMRDFLAAVATRGKPVADIEQGHISTASCILANLAMKTGRTLVYDPEKKQIVGDPEANALLRRPYRAPWTHPEIPNA